MSFVNKGLHLLLLASLAALLPSCAGVTPLTAERPQPAAFRTALPRVPSSVNVPIEASTADIARALNRAIGTAIYRGSTRYSGLTADILKNGPIVVTAADDYVYLTIPVSLTLNYGMFESPAISTRLRFKLTAGVTPDWKIRAEIFYLGINDQFADRIDLGPFSFNPRRIVEGITDPVQRALSTAVSGIVNEEFPLKATAARAWQAAQQPVLLDGNYNAWLELTPQEVFLTPLYARNNRVTLRLGLRTFADLVVGPRPAPRPPVPLPPLIPANSMDRTFRIAVNANLFYGDILRIASPLLLNREFTSDGKRIVIKALDLYGNGERLVVKVTTTGSFDGVFYLTGKPTLDPRTNVFSVKDVEFDLNTRDLLLRSAAWLLHGTIRDAIEEKLTMNLSPQLEQTRAMAEKALSRVKLAENVYLNGSIRSIRVNDLLVQKDRISIQVYGEGESAIVFR